MKKLASLSIIILLITTSSRSQVSSFASLDTNNIDAVINSNGYLFTDLTTTSHGFEAFKGTGQHSIYTSTIWIGAETATGTKHCAANTYYTGNTDFWTGPVADVYDANYDNTYNNLWMVSQTDIQNHISGTSTTWAIENWPAHGDVTNGEAFNLAPFIDVDGDGIYTPTAGDYPKIRGTKCIYYMLNDTRGVHTNSNMLSVGVEVHAMVYAEEIGNSVDNAIQVNYTIYNRSTNDYTEFRVGIFTDGDLGCYSNDYIGCSPDQHTYYFYNVSSADFACGSAAGYGTDPVAQGVTFLNQDLKSFVYFSNTTGPTGDPTGFTVGGSVSDYYLYLQGLWKDSTPYYVGGTGHYLDTNTTSSTTTHIFNDSPTDTAGWSEYSEGNPLGDRRGLGTVGPFVMNSGQEICVDLAYTFTKDTSLNNLSVVDQLLLDVEEVQAHYDSNHFQCALFPIVGVEEQETFNINFFPNPTSGNVHFDGNDVHQIKEVIVVTTQGKKVLAGHASTGLNLSSVAPGIYILLIELNDGQIIQRKLIKR